MIALRASALSAVFIDCFNSLSTSMFTSILTFAVLFAMTMTAGSAKAAPWDGPVNFNEQANKWGTVHGQRVRQNPQVRHTMCQDLANSQRRLGITWYQYVVAGYKMAYNQRNWDFAGYRLAQNEFASQGGCRNYGIY